MRIRALHVIASAAVGVAVFVACGSRTGLYSKAFPPPTDAGWPFDDTGELYEGGPLDVTVECSSALYCDATDPGHILKCGTPVYQCGSLEQCEVRNGAPQCINPCKDSLGNDTSNGCEFYAVEMDTTDETKGACYAVFVVNQWKTGQSAKMLVTRAGQNLPPIEQYTYIPVGTGTGITYQPYDPNAGLATGEIAILFLSRDPAALDYSARANGEPSDPGVLANCPEGVTPAIVGDAALHGTGIANAFRIQTNVPVVAYQMLPYGGGRARVTGSTLLMPTNTWDTNYVIADAYKASPLLLGDGRSGPTTVVIASQDSTQVIIKPKVAIDSLPPVPGADAGELFRYTLNQGQYLQITPDHVIITDNLELTGSALQSDKPVGVIGGATLMDVPANDITYRADSAEQMIPPVRALGSEYVAVRYSNRHPETGVDESPPWRLVGVVTGTQVTFDPPRSAIGFNGTRNGVAFDPSVNGVVASFELDASDLVEFTDPGPFVVTSQDSNHPFFFASYMTGGKCNGALNDAGACVPSTSDFQGFGDPEFIVVVPPAQYLPRYTFFTDPTYPETNLVVVRVRDAATGQWPDITLDCPVPPPAGAGVLTGWSPVGTSGNYEMTRRFLSTGNFSGVNGCDNGVRSITGSFASPTVDGSVLVPRFGVTIWGWGNNQTYPYDGDGPGGILQDETDPRFTRWVSYGYPAGANFQPLNTAVMSTQP